MLNKRFNLLLIALIVLFSVFFAAFKFFQTKNASKAIKVGVLHSLSGPLAISEAPVCKATLLSIEEINLSGGILGKQLYPIVKDGESNPEKFAEQAQKLIEEEGVDVIFGCWSSSCRKAVLPILEKNKKLLFYPVEYEGFEESDSVVYLGATPNQNLCVAIKWLFDQNKQSFFMIGSDYIYPRVSGVIGKKTVDALGGRYLGEQFLALDDQNFDTTIEQIKTLKPDVILNTLNGDQNIAFFEALSDENIPLPTIISFSIGESELSYVKSKAIEGSYISSYYFDSLNTKGNDELKKTFSKEFSVGSLISAPMASAYYGVKLFEKAALDVNSVSILSLKQSIKNTSMPTAYGIISIDSMNNCTWQPIRIGRVKSSNKIEIVFQSNREIPPEPFIEAYGSKKEWENILDQLNEKIDSKAEI